MSRVVVIGGGIIGLAIAWELSQRNADVIVLDARTAGMAASAANAGYIASTNPGPVPTPGLVKTSLKLMTDPESPLYIKPRANVRFMAWLYRFWRACNAPMYAAGLEASVQLLRETDATMQRWRDAGVNYETHDFGRLVAYQRKDVMEHDLAGYDKAVSLGNARPEPMYGDDLHQFEPMLSNEITAAYFLRNEHTVEPISYVRGLTQALNDAGVEIRQGSPVVDITTTHGRATAVSTPSGRIEAAHVVIATGAWSGEAGRMNGTRLPIEGGKGYALDFNGVADKPQRSISLRDAKIAVTPFNDRLRLSGTMEISGINDTLSKRRIAAIHAGGKRFLNGVPEEPTHVRSGMRPMTPDGLPVLGTVPGFSNVSVATGHSMLGVTMAAVTGTHMAELITTGTTADVLKSFTPDRFKGLF